MNGRRQAAEELLVEKVCVARSEIMRLRLRQIPCLRDGRIARADSRDCADDLGDP